MSMRLDLRFARPLAREHKLALAAAAAALAKVRCVRFQRGDREAYLIAEELSRARLAQALDEVGLKPESIASTLADDSRCDEAAAPAAERVRAPGR